MNRLPTLIPAALALALLAAAPARANEPAAVSAEAVAVATPATSAAERPAQARAEAALVVEPTSWRETASPSRPAKRWATSAEVDSGSYRVSLSRGNFDMGMGFDAPAGISTRTARSVDPAGPIPATLPSLSVGLRRDTGPAPSSLIERARAEGAAPSSTQRVGLEWKPAQSSLFVRGGVRLTGDDRVTMRVKSGRVGVYMKSTF